MTDRGPAAVDERPHAPGGPGWFEVWSFDLVDAGAGIGFHLALELGGGRAVVRAALVGEGRELVALVADDLPPPRTGLEVRGPGLWASVECETPLDHWSLGLEAFAVALEDPWEALGAARGDRTPLGADLEWEATTQAGLLPGPGEGYEIPSLTHGEVLVGAERVVVDGVGVWTHHWGPSSAGPWSRHRAAGGASRPVELAGRTLRPADLRDGGPTDPLRVTVDGVPQDIELLAVAPAPTARGPVVRTLVRPVRAPDAWGWLLVGGESVTSS